MAVDYEKANGNKLLRGVTKKNEEKLNATKVVDLPLDMIDPNPDNAKIFNMDKIEGLANSIKLEGFTGAIEVIKKPDGRYEISSGHRRVEAMKLLNRDKIPAIVSSSVGDIQKARKLLTSNINNRVLTPLDMSNCIEYYIENVLKPSGFKGNTRDECAKFFGISATQVHRYRTIGKMIPELRELTKNESFPYSAFEKAIGLTEEQQLDLYEFLKNTKEQEDVTITKTQIVQLINTVRKKKHQRNSSGDDESKSISLKDININDLDRIEKEQKESIVYPHEQYYNNTINEIKKSTVDFLQNEENVKKEESEISVPQYSFAPLNFDEDDISNQSDYELKKGYEEPPVNESLISFSQPQRYAKMMNMPEDEYSIKLDDLLKNLKHQTYQLKEIDYSVGNKEIAKQMIKDIVDVLKGIEDSIL